MPSETASKKYKFTYEEILVRELVGIGRYFKIIVNSPISQIINVFVNQRGVITVNGFEIIPDYYRDISKIKDSINSNAKLSKLGDVTADYVNLV